MACLRRRSVARSLTILIVASILAGCTGGSHDDGETRSGAAAPPDAEVLVAFGLARDDEALADAVMARSDPTRPEHLEHLDLDELADDYGASADTVAEARSALTELGIPDAELDPTRSVLVATVTADQARALGVDLVVQEQPDGSEVVLPSRDPEVPDALDGPVTEIVGLTATLTAAGPPPLPPAPSGATPDPGCGDADLASDASVQEYLRYFGTGPLYDAGYEGQGTSIAIWAVERFDPSSLAAFTACRESPTVVPEVVEVPLTPLATPGEEVTLDVVMAGWTAPRAELVVVQFDPFVSPVFPLVETLRADVPTFLSTSVTFCEAALPEDELAVSERLLTGLAALGVTVLSASGDHGVAGCYPGREDPGAAYPASSPYVTAVGGTDFELSGERILGETVWKDAAAGTASGGGASGHFDLPAFQADAGIEGDRRRYPDIASFAAVNRLNSVPLCDAVACDWRPVGGTSATAPTLAANLALVVSASIDGGGPDRLGWINPLLGSLVDADDSPITDITTGDNRVLGNDCCDAELGFDDASGWGSLDDYSALAEVVTSLGR